jgi:hypothetical protein
VSILLPSVESLMVGAVDYAGLFPPADLNMATAVANYGSYRSGDYRFLLGRFILPASRLSEFVAAAEPIMPRRRTDEPWRLAALVGPDIAADLRTVAEFNSQYGSGQRPRAVVDAIETKGVTADQIEALLAAPTPGIDRFVELPIASDPTAWLVELARRGVKAKVRTGGVTPDAIPASADVVRFLAAASRVNIPFKATAGLHHAVRGSHPLTYKADSPRAVMYGFLNLLMAAALLRTGASEADAQALLDESDPGAFQFGPVSVRWRDSRLSNEQIHDAREQFALSFGSCSFQEPVDELRSLHLL